MLARALRELIGKRVLPLRGEGTWQEYVKTSADFVVLFRILSMILQRHKCILILLQRGLLVQKR